MSDVPPTRKELQCLICGDRGRFNVGSLRRHQLARHLGAALPVLPGRGGPSACRNGDGQSAPRGGGDGSTRDGGGGLLARCDGGGPSASRGGGSQAVSRGGDGRTALPGGGGLAVRGGRGSLSEPRVDGAMASPSNPARRSGGTSPPVGGHDADRRCDGAAEPDARSGRVSGDGLCGLHAEDEEIAALLSATREVAPRPPRRSRKRSRAEADDGGIETTHPSVATRVWALYESYYDAARAQPLARAIKRSKAGMFNSNRLRLMQSFVYKAAGCGLSGTDVSDLWELFHEWEPPSTVNADEPQRLRDIFPTPHAFQQALSDDIDKAIEDGGWMACNIVEDGESYDTFYRPGLPVLLRSLSASNKVRYWAKGDEDDGPSDCRETPFDGDAFRLCEQDVLREHGEDAFVLGIHVFSDSCVMSSSGGKRCALVLGPRDGSCLAGADGSDAAG